MNASGLKVNDVVMVWWRDAFAHHDPRTKEELLKGDHRLLTVGLFMGIEDGKLGVATEWSPEFNTYRCSTVVELVSIDSIHKLEKAREVDLAGYGGDSGEKGEPEDGPRGQDGSKEEKFRGLCGCHHASPKRSVC
jgi:hypothetical protein